MDTTRRCRLGRFRKGSYVAAAALAARLVAPDTLFADVIVDQSAGQTGRYIGSQEFPDIPAYTVAAFDDFALGAATSITSLTVFGRDFYGNPANNIAVVAGIYATPDLTVSPIASASGIEVRTNTGADLLFDFSGVTLPAGTYWLAAYIVRPNSQAGWYWNLRLPISRSQAMWHNPGGGFGYGTSPIRIGDVLEEADLAFILNGNPAPAAATPTFTATRTPAAPATPTSTPNAASTSTSVPTSTSTRTRTATRTSNPTRTRTPTLSQGGNQQGGSGGQGNN